MKLEAGKSYHIHVPNSPYQTSKVHIEYILDNPVDEFNQEESKLIVYRVWIKHKKYWHHRVDEYYALCMYNNWRLLNE